MVVSIKDSLKLIGVSVICCCAVLVCTMFLNFNLDISEIKGLIDSAPAMALYEAQVMTSKVVIAVTGGCLFATSIVTLIFYVKHFIDSRKKELGILKALGYSDGAIAGNFWVFGLSVLLGSVIGFALAYAVIPSFYEMQNADKILPDIPIRFHAESLAFFVILPTVVLGAIAILYAYIKLKRPVIGLLKESQENGSLHNFQRRSKKMKENKRDIPFINALRRDTLSGRKSLVFFIWFASFCFAAMIQMSVSMIDLASEMMAVMMMVIGIVLACTTLLLAIVTVIKSNAKTVAVMRANGYSHRECVGAVFGGYRPFAYAGFAIGTGYQYGLLKLMVTLVFKDIEGISEYGFDWKTMLIALAVFVVLYEAIMLLCAERIKKISIKTIMIE